MTSTALAMLIMAGIILYLWKDNLRLSTEVRQLKWDRDEKQFLHDWVKKEYPAEHAEYWHCYGVAYHYVIDRGGA